MTRRSIHVEGLHHGGLPIPQASLVGSLLMSGGISPIDPGSGNVPDDVEQQVEVVFDNVRRVVEAAGGDVGDIAKCTVFVEDKSIRPVLDECWVRMFPEEASRPARHVLRIDLPPTVHLQIEITAFIGQG